MSVLTLVRHAQASFLSANYDELSPLGIEQAQRLGAYWLRQEVVFDRVYCGPCERHRETAAAVAEVHAQAGLKFPDIQVLEDLNEFNLQPFIYSQPQEILRACPQLQPLYDEFEAASESQQRRRAFQLLFEEVAACWVDRQLDQLPELESWADFSARVARATALMRSSQTQGERVAAFTSGGPIAAIVQLGLDLSARKAIDLIWVLRNAAFTEFFYTKDRFSLGCFNAVPHFREGRLLTYR